MPQGHLHYEILQITPVTGFQYVTAEIIDGVTQLTPHRLDALGVAAAYRGYYVNTCDRQLNYVREIPGNETVGLTLEEGRWVIVNSLGNFAGICRRGDNPKYVTWHLAAHYLNALPETQWPAPEPGKPAEI